MINLITLQATVTDNPGNFASHWEFWFAVVSQLIAFVIIIWRASIYLGNKITDISGKVEQNEKEIKCLTDKHSQMEDRVDKIEENFNHRFTEYKDFMHALIDAKFNNLFEKLTHIERTLAYLKGRSKISEKEDGG